ncbi:MAG: DUF5717 family protein [Lachnospiraceae bacterium]|nr:DUF5717 family protein [Lachnospiraceae bacterium]
MREKINRLAKGIVDADIPELSITPLSLEETIQAGEITRRELFVADTQGRFVKGLVYSSNLRVRILNNAFGGNRNHITYEVDGNHLSKEDVIEGAFYLVTNGGEKKVPYSFSVELGKSGKTLDALKVPADFADLTHRDQELALRLFEYQDFVEAPFMQSLSVRALYDGLRGRLNRQNQLEEFLVALKAKEPVRLEIAEKTKQYDGLTETITEKLVVKSSTWGYVQFEVSADGDFLELPKKSFTIQDFKDGVCEVTYQVNPGRIHRGKNLGAIRITAVRESFTIPVEVQAAEESEEKTVRSRQEELQRYFVLRLEYESGMYEDRLLINQMKQELDRIRRQFGEDLSDLIRQAELLILEGQKERAGVLLESCKDQVMAQKKDQRDLYCYYQYLQMQVRKKDGQRESLLRTVKKYLEEDPCNSSLYLLRLRLEPSAQENPSGLLDEMKAMFAGGCHSPYLYTHVFRIYEKNMYLLKRLDDFEVQVLLFAAKRGLVDKELALHVAELAGVVKHYRTLYYRLMVLLYEKYQEKELLSAVCCILIKGDCRNRVYFPWYQKALEAGVSLTRLYEYFLYALPREYPYLLPKEILLYFSYEKAMDDYSRSVLYMNILKYMKPEAALYKQYERDIEQFTMEQLLHSRINHRFVVLYEHMVYKEMIDERVAKVLPSLLKSYRVQIKNANIRYVVVCYEEIEGEDAFLVQDGVAYVPLFSEHPVLLFQDEYGNRYHNISYRKLPAMEKKNAAELEEQCYDIFPNHPMLRLQECGEIVAAGIQNESELMTMKRALTDLKLHPLFRKRILSGMIDYYKRQLESEDGEAGEDVDYLMDLDLDRLDRAERNGVCETLISQDYIREAYEIIQHYGCEGIRGTRLLKLCTKMVLQQLFDEDDGLLSMACMLFSEGKYDSVLLDYLCEHFNGSAKQMFKILNQGVHEHVETYDMPERLLAQMLFSGETDRIDQVFDWYAAGKKTSENVVRAYFTLRSAEYFLKDTPTQDRVFAYLEGAVHGMEERNRIPTIYLLALTRYYSTLKVLDEERKSLCSSMVELLMEEGRIFAYFHDLGRLIDMPDSIMDKVIVEYRGSRDSKPELELRILPEDEEYSFGELKKVYPGVFTCQKVLFEGEILEYQVYEQRDGVRTLVSEGSLSCDTESKKKEGSRFASLNEMGLCLSLKEEDTLKEKMKNYLTDGAVMEALFDLM